MPMSKGSLTRTHISIREDQKDWIERNHINLSALVRDSIDDRMD